MNIEQKDKVFIINFYSNNENFLTKRAFIIKNFTNTKIVYDHKDFLEKIEKTYHFDLQIIKIALSVVDEFSFPINEINHKLNDCITDFHNYFIKLGYDCSDVVEIDDYNKRTKDSIISFINNKIKG